MTPRNAPLFGAPGIVYVYRSYGIHLLLNFVADAEGIPGAVLIRAIEPDAGLETIRVRRGEMNETDLCSGPGKVGQALAVDLAMNGRSFEDAGFALLDSGQTPKESEILSGPRIGISRAVERPWRFQIESAYVSRPRLTSPRG